MAIRNIEGFKFFKTEVQKQRLSVCYNLVLEFRNKILHFIPNMTKDPEGAISIEGLFITTENLIFEFRSFLSAIDFDIAKYDNIFNIRYEAKDMSNSGNSWGVNAQLEIELCHSITGGIPFTTQITVFGAAESKYLFTLTKEIFKKSKCL